MSISKVASSIVKTINKNKITPKETNQVSNKVSKFEEKYFQDVFEKSFKDYGEIISKDAMYHRYSQKTKDLINKFRKNECVHAKLKNKEKIFTEKDKSLKNLVTICDDEKIISLLLKNPLKFSVYFKNLSKLNKRAKNVQVLSAVDKKIFLTKLALMKIFNKKNYRVLLKSKGMEEIFDGNLSASYLKDIEVMGNYDENFFYKMFESSEKNNNKRIIKSGFNQEIINKYFKMQDKEICINPNFCGDFLTKLEEVKNPELVNKILNKFSKSNSNNIQNNAEWLNKILDFAKENPQNIEKVLEMKKGTLYSILDYLTILKNKETCKISEGIHNYYLELEKTNPEFCKPSTIGAINAFLNNEGCDEKLLKDVVSMLCKNKNIKNKSDILYQINQNNVEYLKECVKKGELTQKDIFKISQTKKSNLSPVDFESIDKLYNETYIPIKNILDKKLDKDFSAHVAEKLAIIKRTNPEKFKELEELKIFELIEQDKINPRILYFYNDSFEFLPEIKLDIQKLLKSESLIKKFNTTENVLKETKSGDVISIKGKMYINNNGKLETWAMTEDKFNDLFPLVDRFSTVQGDGDCYLISVLNSLYKNPKTRGLYYKMFKQKGNDILVTIPAYKDFGGAVRFPNAEIKITDMASDASKNVQMLEQAYARVSLRNSYDILKSLPNNENPLETKNLDFLYSRIFAGRPYDVYDEFLVDLKKSKNFGIKKLNDKNKIVECLTQNLNNPNYIITEQHTTNANLGHVIGLDKINTLTNKVVVVDPNYPAVSRKNLLSEILEKISSIVVVHLD